MIKTTYRWKDNKGNLRVSDGVRLTKQEQQAICRKNLQLIEIGRKNGKSLLKQAIHEEQELGICKEKQNN